MGGHRWGKRRRSNRSWYDDNFDDYSYGYYRPRPTIKAKGGIKAVSKRGAFGESWWAKRWIATLEGFNIGSRLDRGRSYARSGQVLSIDVEKGEINSKVQGSRPTPYAVKIKLQTLTDAEWKRAIDALSKQAIFAAKLHAGEMPQEIEQVFTDAKVSLFPERLRDLATSCSCPDSSNPCKHIAAVYYLLAEEFDRDPFLLFKLRGLTREEFTKRLGPDREVPDEPEAAAIPSQPLTIDPTAFWSGGELPADFLGEVQIPPVSAAILKRLGAFPFWRGSEPFLETLEPVYAKAGPAALEVFIGGEQNQGS